ncbi:MAG: glycosyltransferase, partial [Bacteroidetes bacterium]|nr:glycosyltransferase [Bacteroidota bacterium]
MTHVAMIVLSFYPADPRVRREAETLERQGISVDVICMRGPDEKKVEEIGRIKVYRVIKGSNKENMVKYLLLSTKFMIISFAVLCYLSFKKRYKLIQAHNMPDYLIFTGIIHKIIGVPLILDLHDLTVELFETKWGRHKRILNSLVKFAEKISCGFANEIITTSTGFKERLIERGITANKITLVLNSADHYIFKFNPQREFHKIQKDLRLLYHGTVTKRFGLTTVIEAVAQLQDTIPETTLEIYGKYDDSYREELYEKINSLGINDHIILGGYLSLEEISLKIEHSHIGIVPYLSDPFMNLALSTKTFEYVAM